MKYYNIFLQTQIQHLTQWYLFLNLLYMHAMFILSFATALMKFTATWINCNCGSHYNKEVLKKKADINQFFQNLSNKFYCFYLNMYCKF